MRGWSSSKRGYFIVYKVNSGQGMVARDERVWSTNKLEANYKVVLEPSNKSLKMTHSRNMFDRQ